MISSSLIFVICALSSASGPAKAPQSRGETGTEWQLAIGKRHSAVLDAGKTVSIPLEIRTDEAGALTIGLESLDFDAFLRVCGAEGKELASADGGGLGTDVRFSLSPDSGSLELVVSARFGGAGEFTLWADRDPDPLPTGRALIEANAAYWREAARHAGDRGNLGRELLGWRVSGQYELQLGHQRAALESFQQGLAQAQSESRTIEATFARAHVGALLGQLGAYQEARGHLQQAIDDLKPERDVPLRVFCLNNLGELELKCSRFDSAEAIFSEALEVGRRGGRSDAQIDALSQLGRVRARRGEHDRAREAHDEAVEQADKLGGHHRVRARIAFAESLVLAGHLSGAASVLEEALERAEPGHLRALALGQLGQVQRRSGHPWLAAETLTAALEECEEGRHEDAAAIVLIELALVARLRADYDGAREHLERAMILTEEAAFADLRVRAIVVLAALSNDLGGGDECTTLYEQALQLARDLELADVEIRCLINLGQFCEERGELDRARRIQTEALERADEIGAEKLAALAQVNLGYVRLLTGNPRGAVEISRVALARLDALGLSEPALAPLETLAQAAIMLGDVAGAEEAVARAEQILERNSGRLSADLAAGWRSRHAWWAEVLPQDLALLQVAETEPDTQERARVVGEGFRRSSAWKGRALLAGMSEGGERQRPAVELVKSLTAPGTLLVEYALGSERLVAYAANKGGIRFVDLGPRDGLEKDVESFVELVSLPEGLGGPQEIGQLGAALFARLLEPVLRDREEVERLVIVPTAVLSSLPFEALVTGRRDGSEAKVRSFRQLEFVIDRWLVVHGPSTPILAHLQGLAPSDDSGRMLVLADPIYASEQARGAAPPVPGPLHFRRLLGTREEALTIARLLLEGELAAEYGGELLELFGTRSGLLETPRFTLCLGAEAAPARLREASASWSVIHCAAHGLVDREHPENTGLALSFSAESSGFVSVSDLLELELRTDLAVLSACETARGKVLAGEGVQSIANAFLRAGARSVVASLWKLRDLEGAELMKRFYELRLGGELSTAEALREAKLVQRDAEGSRGLAVQTAELPQVLSSGHPYFWAAVVYIGLP